MKKQITTISICFFMASGVFAAPSDDDVSMNTMSGMKREAKLNKLYMCLDSVELSNTRAIQYVGLDGNYVYTRQFGDNRSGKFPANISTEKVSWSKCAINDCKNEWANYILNTPKEGRVSMIADASHPSLGKIRIKYNCTPIKLDMVQ